MMFELNLPSGFDRWLTTIGDWLFNWGEDWEKKKKERTKEIQSRVKTAVNPAIRPHQKEAKDVALAASDRAHNSVLDELDRVMKRLGMTEDRPLEQSVAALDDCLGQVVFPPVVPGLIMASKTARAS